MELYPEGGIKDTTVHFPAVGYDRHDSVGVCVIKNSTSKFFVNEDKRR